MSWTQNYPFDWHSTVPHQAATFVNGFSAHGSNYPEQSVSQQEWGVATSLPNQLQAYPSVPSFPAQVDAPIWERRESQSCFQGRTPAIPLPPPQILVWSAEDAPRAPWDRIVDMQSMLEQNNPRHTETLKTYSADLSNNMCESIGFPGGDLAQLEPAVPAPNFHDDEWNPF